MNGAGLGTPQITSPAFVAPSLQVPGRPQTIGAVTGSQSGEIVVTWQRPTVPGHGYPCAGLLSAPQVCPSTVIGGLPCTDGGTPITEYAISYNDQEDFSGFDSGEITTPNTIYTIQHLTPGRKYYLRILARNAQGAGTFCRFMETNCVVVNQVVTAFAKV
jgi:hypothetical protein